MKRALLKQILHEWRTNIWLVLELAVVVLAIWAIITFLWVECKGLFYPLGFSPEGVYSIEVKEIPSTSPYFLADYADKYYEDRNELLRRLRNNPNVEYASLHNNFAPFEYSFSGNNLVIEGYPDSIGYFGNFRTGEPDIIKVINIKSLTGKSQDQLVEMMRQNKVLLSPNENLKDYIENITDLIGKKVCLNPEDDKYWVVGDIVERVRRSNYEYYPRGVVIMPFLNINKTRADIVLKVKPGKEKDFQNDFNTDPSLTKLRNVYLSNLTNLIEKGESLNREIEINIRLLVAISFFLLITIFLGLLGSFWFRVQQRISEIAIRKTFGATNKDLFRRTIGEGLLLLLGGLILVSACVWPFIKDITDNIYEEWWTILAIEGITAGMIAMCIILSLWYPAYRAMKIEPAIAVKED